MCFRSDCSPRRWRLSLPLALRSPTISRPPRYGLTGPLQAYAKQTGTGLKLGSNTRPTGRCRSTGARLSL
jgi:hypothetical protein